jgi:hypothetical protein
MRLELVRGGYRYRGNTDAGRWKVSPACSAGHGPTEGFEQASRAIQNQCVITEGVGILNTPTSPVYAIG